MKSVLLICMALALSSEALAKKNGGVGGGGGKGCDAIVLGAGFQVYLWMKKHGHNLNPKVDLNSYRNELDSSNLVEVPETQELLEHGTYGKPVTGRYDASLNKILIRCDRVNKENNEGLKRFAAHEIFRKMRLEGDKYEISRQIFGVDEKPDLSKILSGSVYTVVGKKLACDARVVVNSRGPEDKEIVLTFVNMTVNYRNYPVRCSYAGWTLVFRYDPQDLDGVYSAVDSIEVLEPMSNGDFLLRYFSGENDPLTFTVK